MIDFLRGIVAYAEEDYIALDVGGVGYRVFCANPYGFSRKSAEETTVYVHHQVREDAHLLFGFATREEQRLFRTLLDVSGIGPRVALGILSGGHPDAVIAAIQQENLAFLTRLPGIGKKTAQRMVLDLKDKLGGVAVSVEAMGAALADAPAGEPGGDAWSEAKEGLLALGYSEAEIARIAPGVQKGLKPGDKPEDLMKRALAALFKG